MFEIGLWKINEMPKLLDLIHSKIETLFTEEAEIGHEHDHNPEEHSSIYYTYYYEMVACIVNQSAILYNDKAYINAIKPKSKFSILKNIDNINRSLKSVYFNKQQVFNQICFI